jgi:hypothetical protein
MSAEQAEALYQRQRDDELTERANQPPQYDFLVQIYNPRDMEFSHQTYSGYFNEDEALKVAQRQHGYAQLTIIKKTPHGF